MKKDAQWTPSTLVSKLELSTRKCETSIALKNMKNEGAFIANMHLNSPVRLASRRMFREKGLNSSSTQFKKQYEKSNTLSTNELFRKLYVQSGIEKIDLLKLGDWLKFSACTLKVRKNIYNRAIMLLKIINLTKEIDYEYAGASLALIIKFEQNGFFYNIPEFPLLSDIYRYCQNENEKNNMAVVKVRHLYALQGEIMKTIRFRLPMKDDLIELIIIHCEKWSRYAKTNIKSIRYPPIFLEVGLENQHQQRNIFNISYLIDIMHLNDEMLELIMKRHEKQIENQQIEEEEYTFLLRRNNKQEILIINLAIFIVVSTNCCEKINSWKKNKKEVQTEGNRLYTCMVRYMKKCQQLNSDDIQSWKEMLEIVLRGKITDKLRNIPLKPFTIDHPDQINYLNSNFNLDNKSIFTHSNQQLLSNKIQLMEKIQYVSMCCEDDMIQE